MHVRDDRIGRRVLEDAAVGGACQEPQPRRYARLGCRGGLRLRTADTWGFRTKPLNFRGESSGKFTCPAYRLADEIGRRAPCSPNQVERELERRGSLSRPRELVQMNASAGAGW